MDDLISRQAAIDAAECIVEHHAITPYKTMAAAMDHLKRILNGMSSAQPKIKCIANITITNEQVQEAFEKVKADMLAAQPERKKGKWIKNDIDGWMCSECEKSNVYAYTYSGRLQDYFCPNCGADMRGEQDG